MLDEMVASFWKIADHTKSQIDTMSLEFAERRDHARKEGLLDEENRLLRIAARTGPEVGPKRAHGDFLIVNPRSQHVISLLASVKRLNFSGDIAV